MLLFSGIDKKKKVNNFLFIVTLDVILIKLKLKTRAKVNVAQRK